MYSCLSPSCSGACSTSIFMRMSAGMLAAVALETTIIRPIASGTVQIAGCSQRILSNGWTAKKSFRPLKPAKIFPIGPLSSASVAKLVSAAAVSAHKPPVSMPVAAPFIVMPRHQTLMKSSGK